MINDIKNGQSAAKLLSVNTYEEGSTTIPIGSTFDNNQREKEALLYFYCLIDPRDGILKYIGRTVNPKHRLNHHYYEARVNNRCKRERWINKLLKMNLKPIMRILHSRYCDINEAIRIEKRLVLYFNKFNNLKNSPDNYLGAMLTGKKVYQYDLNGEFIKEYANSNQAYIITNIKDCNISRCCIKENLYNINKNCYHSSGNYLWSFNKFEKYPLVYIKLRKSMKSVNQYDLNMNLINSFDCARDASNYTGVCYKQISSCCVGSRKTVKGFIWKFNNKI